MGGVRRGKDGWKEEVQGLVGEMERRSREGKEKWCFRKVFEKIYKTPNLLLVPMCLAHIKQLIRDIIKTLKKIHETSQQARIVLNCSLSLNISEVLFFMHRNSITYPPIVGNNVDKDSD